MKYVGCAFLAVFAVAVAMAEDAAPKSEAPKAMDMSWAFPNCEAARKLPDGDATKSYCEFLMKMRREKCTCGRLPRGFSVESLRRSLQLPVPETTKK